MDCCNVICCIVKRLWNGALNQRNVITLPLNFLLNFSVIFIWLMVFKNAGLIPIDWRPKIHSKFAFFMDVYLFGDYWDELLVQYNSSAYFSITIFTSFAFTLVCLILLPLAIWYYIYYIKKVNYNILEWNDHIFHFNNRSNPKRMRAFFIPFFLPLFVFVLLNLDHFFAVQTDENFTEWKDLLAWFSYVILHLTAPILTAVYLYVFHPPGTVKCFALALGFQNLMGVATHLLIPMAPPWFVHLYGINVTDHVNYQQEGYAAGLTRVDTQLGTHLNTAGFHLSPIVFGAVPSLHSAMAFQCFLFLITRSTTLKNRFASGSDIHKCAKDDVDAQDLEIGQLNADVDTDADADHDQDSSLDESSTCSTIVCEEDGDVLTFITYYKEDACFTSKWYFAIFNKAILPTFLGTGFILLQWWATIYLDHHYRFDLFIGALYALFMHIVINTFLLQPRVLTPWVNVRMGKLPDTKNEGRTLGMRVFQDTKMEWFFDPLA